MTTYEVRFADEEGWFAFDGFDAEDAAADFVEAAFDKGMWSGEDVPQSVDVVTRACGVGAAPEVPVEVYIDWSPSFVGRAR